MKKTICLTTLFLLILGSITVFATSPVELIVSPEKKIYCSYTQSGYHEGKIDCLSDGVALSYHIYDLSVYPKKKEYVPGSYGLGYLKLDGKCHINFIFAMFMA